MRWRLHGHRDLVLGILLGLVLGLVVVALFVFVFSENAVDAPSIDDQPAPLTQPAPGTP